MSQINDLLFWGFSHLGDSAAVRAKVASLFVSTAGQKTVNQGHVGSITMLLPPLAEQHRIVARVEELMKLCDALEENGRLAGEQHEQLVSTLLDVLVNFAASALICAQSSRRPELPKVRWLMPWLRRWPEPHAELLSSHFFGCVLRFDGRHTRRRPSGEGTLSRANKDAPMGGDSLLLDQPNASRCGRAHPRSLHEDRKRGLKALWRNHAELGKV